MPIPAIFHQTNKTKHLVEPYRKYQNRLLDLHPDWDYRFYDDHDSRKFIKKHFPLFLPVYDNCATSIQKTDIFRIIAVYAVGGFYLDLDVECLNNIDPLCKYNCVFGVEKILTHKEAKKLGHKSNIRIANYMFGSRQGHPFLLYILLKMAQESDRKIRTENDILESTGPGIVTRTYFNCKKFIRDIVLLNNTDRICPNPYCRQISCHFGNYAKHYHTGSWRDKTFANRKSHTRSFPRKTIISEIKSQIRQISIPENIYVLKTYTEKSHDGLSTVFNRAKEIGIPWKNSRKLKNKKVLISGMPFLYTNRISSKNINIIYTTFESTRLPEVWVKALNTSYHYCIVPHKYVKSIFQNSGIKIPIKIIPQGFTRYRRLNQKLKIEKHFRVGFLGIPVFRKNLFKLFQACLNLLYEIPSIKLTIHISSFYDWLDKRELELIRSAPFVECTEGKLSEDLIAKWYKKLSCYVFPSGGEGWSFTPRESLYLGIPTALTDIPVHDELVDSGYYTVIPASEMEDANFNGNISGKWHQIHVKDIENSIRKMYFNYGSSKIKALKGGQWIENKWENENTQQSLLRFINAI